MKYEDMKICILPAGAIIDNFIRGIGTYHYSDYLMEIINVTPFFLEKSNGEPYYKPSSEARGECDCISHSYQLDFKLIASKTKLQATSIFSPQIFYEDGITSYAGPRVDSSCKNYHPIQATRIFAALRQLTYSDFLRIRNQNSFTGNIDRDIFNLIEKVGTDKNLFLFFPYNLYFDEDNNPSLSLKISIQGVEQDFSQLLCYRSKLCPHRDTYLCFLHSSQFIITVWENNALNFVDSVPIDKSPTFMNLLDFSDVTFSKDVFK